MAKGNRQQSQTTRDSYSSISNLGLRLDTLYNQLPTYNTSYLSTIEDRRTYHPAGIYRNARSFNNSYHTLIIPKRKPSNIKKYSYPTHTIGFKQPDKVLICVRRKQRREILFAKNKTGRGGQKRPHYSYYSTIHCRR